MCAACVFFLVNTCQKLNKNAGQNVDACVMLHTLSCLQGRDKSKGLLISLAFHQKKNDMYSIWLKSKDLCGRLSAGGKQGRKLKNMFQK